MSVAALLATDAKILYKMENKNKNEANLSDLTKRFLEEVERMGVSFYNIAKSTGVKEAMFTKIKRGIQEPSKKFLSKFAECFPDANMKYIYLGNEKNNAEHDINNEAFNDYTYRFLETIEKLELTDYKVWNTLENLSKATMSKIRRGICGVSMNTLQEFCQMYKVNANYILTGKGPMFIEDEDSGSSQQDTDSMSLSYDELSRLYETTVSRYERLFGKLEKQFNELEQTITKARNELEQALLDVKNVLEEKKTA